MGAESRPYVGVVVIGRNEGDRLKACLTSVLSQASFVVYVDSGSTDGSVEWARAQGVDVVQLDMSRPFTAARGRNEGFAQLLLQHPDIELVQFVDGDCEFHPGWLGGAMAFLVQHPEVAVVCGRRRERFPLASIFNAQCDREWNTPVGEAKACGGDALMRSTAFKAVGGFRNGLIAGEEPELCVRLRAAGWKVWRLDLEMTLHDAAILRWRQWWRRSRRSGHAFAEGAWLHGAPPERHWVVETRRSVLWGLVLPMVSVATVVVSPLFSVLLLLYPLQVVRIARRSGRLSRLEIQQAALLVLGKFPEAFGAVEFWLKTLLRKRAALIEYK